jgi:hypothetical protein
VAQATDEGTTPTFDACTDSGRRMRFFKALRGG